MSVSEQLGAPKEVRLSAGTIRYRERGSGQPIVFVHGVLVNGDLWRKVVPPLAEGHRCIAPDWPLGSHELPMDAGADLSPPGLARLIADFLTALDLREVTLVGNDTGGALAQLVAANHPERLGRLVLTSCDAFWNFPPHATKPFQPLGYVPGFDSVLARATRPRGVQRALLGSLAKRPLPPEIHDSYTRPALSDARVRREFLRLFRQLRPRYTLDAAEKLRSFHKPALIVWAAEDKFFPMRHARRLAELLPDARLQVVEDSRTFIAEDQPERLSALIADFMREPAAAAA